MSSSSINLMSSSIDVQSIVDNLIYVDRAPARLMETEKSTVQKRVNAFQSLNTKMSSLLSSVNKLLFRSGTAPLVLPYSFEDRLSTSVFTQQKVSSSDDSIVSVSSEAGTASGSYSVVVNTLAQAKSSASSNFADASTTKVGTGTITLSGTTESPVTITIDDSNNTLAGIKRAINNANAGVTATIINDGTANPYRLLVTSNKTGLANAFTLTENLSGDQALALTEKTAAANATFSVNGIDMSSSSNLVSDQIPGLTFTLKAKSATPVTINLTTDVDGIVSAMQTLVSAYNEVNSYINEQFTYNSTTKTAGVLSGDSTLRSIQSKLQTNIISGVSNRYTTLGIAGQAGLTFNRDGSLTLDESKLRSLLGTNPTDVAALFLGEGTVADGVSATDSRITSATKTSATLAGTYDVSVTALAQKAALTGNQDIETLSAAEMLTITLGSTRVSVALAQNDTLSAAVGKINDALSSAGIAALAESDGKKIKLSSNAYGSSQTLTVISDQADAAGSTGFGTTIQSSTGTDIAGTIDGTSATGSGTTLTGAGNAEGLSLRISQTALGYYGSVTVAPSGQGDQGASILLGLYSSLKGITDPLSGPIHNSTDSLNQTLRDLTQRISDFDERLEKTREIYTAQYQKADEALRMLTVNQSSLAGQMASLSNLS
jgi:flagellar hook-associated protein 2